MNRRSSLRSSSDRRPGSAFSVASAVEPLDRLLEAVALDEPHRVVGPAVVVGAQAVDRDDPGVFQPAGDLGLEQEPLAADRVVGVVVEDLLQGHLAIQLGVQRHEDGPQAAPGVRPEHAEPLAVAGGRADGVGCRCGRHRPSCGRAVCGADVVERRLDVGVADPRQALAGRFAGRDRGQALLDVAAVASRWRRPAPPAARARPRLRSPRASRWSARLLDLSSVQAWKAATSWPWSIRPF